MSSLVQAAAKSAGSPNLKELDETGKGDEESDNETEGFFVKEFFWDKIIILLTSSIIALTALDILTELLRGGNGVVCFIPDELNFSDNQAGYVTSVCSQGVPDAQFLPIFVLVHGVLIAAWHYIWKSNFSSHFDYFFSLTSHMTRFREEVTGEYPLKNIKIINRLETEFCTYRKTKIIRWYQVKLALQVLTAIASILISFLLFNEFNVDFTCRWTDPNEGAMANIPCIFASLRLFSLVRIFDTILLGLIILVAAFAFLWTLAGHPDELGHRQVALFSYSGAINPEHYRPKRLLSPQGYTRIFSPQIQTDFDFLLMTLYKTDSGLAHIFKEGQIHEEKRKFIGTEIRYLTSYDIIDEEKAASGEVEKIMAPNWIIPSRPKKPFKHADAKDPLQVPEDIAGVVMGLCLRAPANGYVIDISFGTQGYLPALARVFKHGALLNFDPEYKNEDEPIVPHKVPPNLTTFRCHPDIFSLGAKQNNKFTDVTYNEIWKKDYKVDFLVIGPLESRDHTSIVLKLLKRYESHYSKGAVLLTVVPTKIEGKKTKFISFTPPTKFFKPLHHSMSVVQGRVKWPPAPPTNPPDRQVTNFSLKCGNTACTFDLKLYEFSTDEDEADTPTRGDQAETREETKEEIKGGGGAKKGDEVPLLQAGVEGGVAGGESSQLLKKRPNTASSVPVQIEMEPKPETSTSV